MILPVGVAFVIKSLFAFNSGRYYNKDGDKIIVNSIMCKYSSSIKILRGLLE
jgi:hypothetical protein